MTSEDARYSNKGYLRKAITILLNKMILFEVVDRPATNYKSYDGVYELGVKFYSSGTMNTIYPTDQSDLNTIGNLAY